MKRRSKQTQSSKHQWLCDRQMEGAFVVLRVDNYDRVPLPRGQFYPIGGTGQIPQDYHSRGNSIALWPTYEKAEGAAKWATEKFGHKYGIFKMVAFVEHATVPVKVAVIK